MIRRFRDYAVGVSATFAGVGFNFLIQIVLARLLDLGQFGQVAVWRNNAQLGASLSGLALQTLGLKRISELKVTGQLGRIATFRRRSLMIVAALSIVAGGLVALVTPWVHPVVSVATVVAMAVLTLLAAGNRALIGGMLPLLAERALQPFLFLAASGLVLLFVGSADVAEMALFFLISVAATLGLIWLAVPRTDRAVDHPAETIPALLRATLPFLSISIASFASARLPLLIGSFIFASAELAQLAFMVAIAGLLQVAYEATNLVAGPRIAAACAQDDWKAVTREVRRVRILSAGLAIPGAAALYLGIPVIGMLAGTDALIVRGPFLILMASGLMAALTHAPSIALQMTDRQAGMAKVANLAVLLKLLAIVPLGLSFGLSGMAAAELLQATAMGVGISIVYARTRRL